MHHFEESQVSIEVYAAAVNFPDLLMTCGGYQLLDLHYIRDISAFQLNLGVNPSPTSNRIEWISSCRTQLGVGSKGLPSRDDMKVKRGLQSAPTAAPRENSPFPLGFEACTPEPLKSQFRTFLKPQIFRRKTPNTESPKPQRHLTRDSLKPKPGLSSEGIRAYDGRKLWQRYGL